MAGVRFILGITKVCLEYVCGVWLGFVWGMYIIYICVYIYLGYDRGIFRVVAMLTACSGHDGVCLGLVQDVLGAF